MFPLFLPPPPTHLWYGWVYRLCRDLGHPDLTDWNSAAIEAPELSLKSCSCCVCFRRMQPLPQGMTSALWGSREHTCCEVLLICTFLLHASRWSVYSSLLALLFKGAVRMFFHHISYVFFSMEYLGYSLKANPMMSISQMVQRMLWGEGQCLNRNSWKSQAELRGKCCLIMLACLTFRLWSTSHRALVIFCPGFSRALF